MEAVAGLASGAMRVFFGIGAIIVIFVVGFIYFQQSGKMKGR